MTKTTFNLTTDSGTWVLRMPETLSYNDGKDIIAINLWSEYYVNDTGKAMEMIMLSGWETDKQSLDWVDDALDHGDEITLSGFNNNDIDGVWVGESFSYTCEQPRVYQYTLRLERVR